MSEQTIIRQETGGNTKQEHPYLHKTVNGEKESDPLNNWIGAVRVPDAFGGGEAAESNLSVVFERSEPGSVRETKRFRLSEEQIRKLFL